MGRRARALGVQKSDREFDIERMTDRDEFKSPQGPRVSASGDQAVIKPGHPFVDLPYILQGYDEDARIGNKSDLIRALYPNDVLDEAGNTVPE